MSKKNFKIEGRQEVYGKVLASLPNHIANKIFVLPKEERGEIVKNIGYYKFIRKDKKKVAELLERFR